MRETIRIVTPEQVELSYEVAGIGSRFLAGLLDGLIQAGLILAGYIVALIVGLGPLFTGGLIGADFITSVIIALLTLYLFAVFWGYFVFFETRWNGQTPGKRKLGLRVIRESGHPVDLRSVLIRNVVRIVDMLPGIYGVGIITMFVSPHWKRLGDHAAGTVVVKERSESGFSPTLSTRMSQGSNEFTILNDEALSRVSTLSREEYEVIRRFLERRSELDFMTSGRLAHEIAAPLLTQLGVNLSINSTRDSGYEKFLEEIAYAYQKVRGR